MKNDHKSDFRKSCIKRLEFTSLFLKYYKNKIIVKKLENFIKRSDSRNILLYIPMDIEVDVKPLIKSLIIQFCQNALVLLFFHCPI